MALTRTCSSTGYAAAGCSAGPRTDRACSTTTARRKRSMPMGRRPSGSGTAETTRGAQSWWPMTTVRRPKTSRSRPMARASLTRLWKARGLDSSTIVILDVATERSRSWRPRGRGTAPDAPCPGGNESWLVPGWHPPGLCPQRDGTAGGWSSAGALFTVSAAGASCDGSRPSPGDRSWAPPVVPRWVEHPLPSHWLGTGPDAFAEVPRSSRSGQTAPTSGR